MLQHLSPLGSQHINLTGDYFWTEPVTGQDQLRPLRQLPGSGETTCGQSA